MKSLIGWESDMARGRMINSKITRNKAINDLSDDTSRLAFTWLVTFADVEGRTNGDPALVRSLVFPRRTDVTVEQMAGYIQEWAEAGLVTWYEAEGDMWIAFPSFEDNQRGLDRRKEPESDIPAPTGYAPSTYQVRTESVPSTVEQNRTEIQQNRTEVGADAPPATVEDVRPTRADPRTKHPAIALVKGITGRNPSKALYDDIIRTIGDQPRGEDAAACYREWITRGYNPASLKWLTEWYQNGIPAQGGNGNGSGSRASPSPPARPAKPAPTTWRNPVSGKVESL